MTLSKTEFFKKTSCSEEIDALKDALFSFPYNEPQIKSRGFPSRKQNEGNLK